MPRRKLRINEIPEEIDSSSGNAVVCLREIIIPEVKGPSKNFYYLETGIIDGNFETMSEVSVVSEVYVPPRVEGDD